MARASRAPGLLQIRVLMLPWITAALFALAGCVSDEIHEIPPEPVCATPTFQPPPGVYIDSALVSIACLTQDATIRYTLDGSTPGDSSEVYLRPITLRTPVSLRARAERLHYQPSDVASAAYDVRSAEITLLSPNGGEIWPSGSVRSIRWSCGTGCGDRVRVILLMNDTPCDTIAHFTANDGELIWTVMLCDDLEASYRIRIEDISTGRFDQSDSPLIIRTDCAIQVSAPNGGERWNISGTYPIQWSRNASCGDSVQILLLHDGSPCGIIADTAENTGVFEWQCNPCGILGPHYAVRIIDLLTGIHDDSDELFEIDSDIDCPLTMLSPNGGERWVEGVEQDIRWIPSGCDHSVTITMVRAGRFAAWIVNSTQDDGSFTWMARRSDPDSTGYGIVIWNPGGSDRSDAPFTIAPNPEPCVMEILEPNRKTIWREGSTPDVIWKVRDCYGRAKIEWIFDGQIRSSSLVDNDGRYRATLWRGSYRGPCGYSIRITDLLAGTVASSDGAFCMTPCEMTITHPAEGDTLYEGRVDAIRWEVSEVHCQLPSPITVILLHDGTQCAVLADHVEDYIPNEWFVQRCAPDSPGPYRIVVLEGEDFADTSGAFTIEYPPPR